LGALLLLLLPVQGLIQPAKHCRAHAQQRIPLQGGIANGGV
jgi:hypothetical protein